MNICQAIRRVLVAVIAIGFLQGCNNASSPAPDEVANAEPVSPVLRKLDNSPTKQVPKSIQRR
jgi:hypothetical protein